MVLPRSVQFCIDTLEKSGFSAYVVGGCVRDSLLGRMPHDYDLCTNAMPEEISRIFGDFQQVHSGEKHGTIGVVIDRTVYEITTFRTEGGYQDSRHPDWVRFVGQVEEDLARRDFTVNAMAYSPRTGYMDPYGGRADLQKQVLRAVGAPAARFTEDPLRILRGVRFAVRFGLRPEAETEQAMVELAPLMDKLAKERVFDELCKLLPHVTASDLQRFSPILTAVIPELAPTVGFLQHNHHHAYDVFTHTAYTTEAVTADPVLRWAALLHDVGKPAAFTMDEQGQGHFKGHAELGAQMADAILRRLKAPAALREQVVFLIGHHMLQLEPDKKLLRRRVSRYGEQPIRQLLILQRADYSSKGTGLHQDEGSFEQTRQLLDRLMEEEDCFAVKDLAVDGRDLLELGFAPGPRVGACLEELLQQVLSEALPNEKDPLLQRAKEYLKEGVL
ncbi:MAG: CCA tRNA nucleotidyltransferase [Oscillospiraceae bacterium]|nr:CCA tRNA nucleotidyltransferase [Oscillospiraceae bacterium]